MNVTARSKFVILAVAAVIAALVAFAVIHARGESLDVTPHAVAASWHPHPCPPRNKHCHRPPPPPTGCTWVIGGAIGDVPRCVPS